MALLRPHDVGLPVAVGSRLHAAEPGERAAIGGGEGPDLEDVVRADAHAVLLRLAAVAIDDGRDPARLAAARLGRLLLGDRARHGIGAGAATAVASTGPSKAMKSTQGTALAQRPWWTAFAGPYAYMPGLRIAGSWPS